MKLQCSKCSQMADKVLMMECPHSLCLECASKLLARLQNRLRTINPHRNISHLQCQICSVISYLQPEALEELSAYRQQNSCASNDRQSLNSTISKNNNPINRQSRTVITSPRVQQPNNLSVLDENIFSNGHGNSAGDPILFCFSCESACFSIDEYLNGMHQGHNVKNIRKRDCLSQMNNMFEALGDKVRSKVEVSLKEATKLTHKKRQLIELFGNTKTSIQMGFEKLRQILAQKEAELFATLEQAMSKRFSLVDSAISQVRQYTQKCQSFEATISKFQEVLDNNTISAETSRAFNFYSKNKPEILVELSRDIQEVWEMINGQVANLCISPKHIHETMELAKTIRVVLKDNEHYETDSRNQSVREANYFETIKQEIFNSDISSLSRNIKTKTPLKTSNPIYALTRMKSLDNLRESILSPGKMSGPTSVNNNIQARVHQKMRNLQNMISGRKSVSKKATFF